MNYETVLNQLQNDEISIEDAYGKMYPVEKSVKPGKRAFFVKMNIKIPNESQKLNTFLRILFMIPIPIVFARIGLSFANRFVKDELDEIDMKEISRLLKYSRNTKVSIDTDDAKIEIKVI